MQKRKHNILLSRMPIQLPLKKVLSFPVQGYVQSETQAFSTLLLSHAQDPALISSNGIALNIHKLGLILQKIKSLQLLIPLSEPPNFFLIKLSLSWALKVIRSNSFILDGSLHIQKRYIKDHDELWLFFTLFQNKTIEKNNGQIFQL